LPHLSEQRHKVVYSVTIDNLDTGGFVALLEFASGKTARVLGKPSTDFFQLAARRLGCRLENIVVVGDDLTTDVAGARKAGARAVLVRTGKFSDESLAESFIEPDLIIDSVADLPRAIENRLV
jgi:ribonucleotide monophosphatase NagD (HAD superfamily)